jgi:hypothetical protein
MRARWTVAAILIIVGVLAALVGEGVWLAGRALAPGSLADAAIQAMRSPDGQEAIADRVEASIEEHTSLPAARAPIEAAVHDVVASGAFPRLMRVSVSHAREDGFSRSGGVGQADLAPLRPLLAKRLAGVDPALAAGLPPGARLGSVELRVGDPLPGLDRAARVLDDADSWALLCAAVAAVLLGAAVAISPQRARTARAAGWRMLLLAALPPLVRLVTPSLSDVTVGDPELGDLAGSLAPRLFAGWWVPALIAGLAGAVLLTAGYMGGAGRRRPAATPDRRDRPRAA